MSIEGATGQPVVGGDDELDFDHAEYDEPRQARITCAACKALVRGPYYAVDQATVCPRCAKTYHSSSGGSFLAALLLGSIAGALGGLVYYGIRELTGYEIALVTIGIGVAVGIAVRAGAGSRSNLVYRLMAVALTYMAVCATFVPQVIEGMVEDSPGAQVGTLVVLVASVISLILPATFVLDFQPIMVIILAVGLWEAWKLSAPRSVSVQGPFDDARMPGLDLLLGAVGSPLQAIHIQSRLMDGQLEDETHVVFLQFEQWLEVVTEDGTTSISLAPDLQLRPVDPRAQGEQHPISRLPDTHPAASCLGRSLQSVCEYVSDLDQASVGLGLDFGSGHALSLIADPDENRMTLLGSADHGRAMTSQVPCSAARPSQAPPPQATSDSAA